MHVHQLWDACYSDVFMLQRLYQALYISINSNKHKKSYQMTIYQTLWGLGSHYEGFNSKDWINQQSPRGVRISSTNAHVAMANIPGCPPTLTSHSQSFIYSSSGEESVDKWRRCTLGLSCLRERRGDLWAHSRRPSLWLIDAVLLGHRRGGGSQPSTVWIGR